MLAGAGVGRTAAGSTTPSGQSGTRKPSMCSNRSQGETPMYPTNEKLMTRIHELGGAKRSRAEIAELTALRAEAIEWVAKECLPLITNRDGWQRRDRIYSGYELDSTWHIVDHPVYYRCGRKLDDFVAVSMPYHIPQNSSACLRPHWRSSLQRELEITPLPNEWSWWLPGTTFAVAVAPPGTIKLPWVSS